MSSHHDASRQQLAADIQERLLKGPLALTLTPHKIPPILSPDLEKRIFDIANQTTIQLATQLHSSNFHTWEFFRPITTLDEAHKAAPLFRAATYPFATCLDMATEAARILMSTLHQDPDLAPYASHVQVATDCKPSVISRARDIHCLTMLHLADSCIVLDLCAQPTAFRVPLNTAHQCHPQLDMLAANIHSFTYAYIAGPGSTRVLLDCTNYETSPADEFFSGLTPFREINKTMYDQFIAFALRSKATQETPHGVVPSRKTIHARRYVEEEPFNPFITHHPLPGNAGYIAPAIALRIDFATQTLLLALPYQDFLLQPSNACFLERLQAYDGFECGVRFAAHGIAQFTVRLGTDDLLDLPRRGVSAQVGIKVGLVDEVCAAWGMRNGEIRRIVGVVVEVWRDVVSRI